MADVVCAKKSLLAKTVFKDECREVYVYSHQVQNRCILHTMMLVKSHVKCS